MAMIIAVCGAGGKSTYIRKRAEQFVQAGKRTAVTTTTHIFDESEKEGSEAVSAPKAELGGALLYRRDGIVYAGQRCEGKETGKLAALSESAFAKLCMLFDVVLVEADGARHLPIKVPDAKREPVIPKHTNEIAVIMGRHAIGRPFGVVCQRAELALQDGFLEAYAAQNEKWLKGIASQKEKDEKIRQQNEKEAFLLNLPVTEDLLRKLAMHYYIEPLQQSFPEADVHLVISDFVGAYCIEMLLNPFSAPNLQRKAANIPANVRAGKPMRRPALILMASGFGRRFGSNKLLLDYQGKPLVLHVLETLLCAAQLLTDNFPFIKAPVPVILVTRYAEIKALSEVKQLAAAGSLVLCDNPDYAEGISGSVRSGARCAASLSCTDFVYFAGDMPNLAATEIARYLVEYIASGKSFGVMLNNGIPSNPGVLSASYLHEILEIHGDRGGMQVIRRHPEAVYYYAAEPKMLKDIDMPQDIAE